MADPPSLPNPPDTPFVVNTAFPACVHPGVKAECNGGWCNVPAGCFVYGSPDNEPLRAALDETQVQVTLTHNFEIQQAELTLEQWRATGWEDPNIGSEAASPCSDPRCPANNTTWYQALQFANWLSEQTRLAPCFRVYDCFQRLPTFGLSCSVELLASSIYECEGYRLPTSAEWEYAARAGTTTAFYSGAITSFEDNYACQLDPNLARIAWYCATTPEPQREQAVAQLRPNAWGLYDVLGNVEEWTMDRNRGVAWAEPQIDPQAALDSGGSATPRGCAFYASSHAYCRSSAKSSSSRDFPRAGLRLARTLGKGTLPTLADVPKP